MDSKLKPINIEDYLEIQPNMMRLKGYRIGIEHIVRCYQEGFTAEQISQEFPGISLTNIYVILAYYLQNKSAIDKFINQQIFFTEQQMKQDDQKTPLPVVKRLRSIKNQKEKVKNENTFFTG